MILWFSGTGNSKFVAEQIGAIIQDDVVSMNQRMIENDFSGLYSERPYVVVCPTYAFNLPRVVKSLLMRTRLDGTKSIYFVLTCGVSTGGAAGIIAEFVASLSMQYKGCGVVKMPENNIRIASLPEEDVAREIIRKSIPHIHEIADKIAKDQMLTDGKSGEIRKLLCKMFESNYYTLYIKDDKFQHSPQYCGKCGKCVRNCPMQNITVDVSGKLVWNGRCTQCMACICGCPNNAIEYGKVTKGRHRYHFPKQI